GTFSLEAAEAVCGSDLGGVMALLRLLVGKSLVLIEDAGADLRYRLLETVRLYVEEKLLQTGEAEDIRSRHRDHFLVLAERLTEAFSWDELDVEHHNIRAALVWSEREGRADLVARLAATSAPNWRGEVSEAMRWLALGMTAVEELEPDQRFRFLASHSFVAMQALDPSTRESARRVVEEFGDREDKNLFVANAFALLCLSSSFDGLVQKTPPVAESERVG